MGGRKGLGQARELAGRRQARVVVGGPPRHSMWWSRAWRPDTLHSKAGELLPFSVPQVLVHKHGVVPTPMQQARTWA